MNRSTRTLAAISAGLVAVTALAATAMTTSATQVPSLGEHAHATGAHDAGSASLHRDLAQELVAVEWAARGPNSNPPGPAEAPTVLGMNMHILVPAVGFHIMHAWVWKPNPAGMFADWNPDVTCP